MPKRVIDAGEALKCIRSGMSDVEIMAKFNISTKGLQSLFNKMLGAGIINQADLDNRTPGHLEIRISNEAAGVGNKESGFNLKKSRRPAYSQKINLSEAVQDIRSGSTDADLMYKYGLSVKGLQHLFRKLIELDMISQLELDERMSTSGATVDSITIMRKLGLDRTQPEVHSSNVPNRCIACGAPQTVEFEECPFCRVNIREFKARKAMNERIANAAWKCPACHRPYDREYDECPVCGVIVAKYKKP